MKTLLVLFLLLFSCLSIVQAQNARVQLTFISSRDSLPVEAAVVGLGGYKANYIADSSGQVNFESRPGRYKLRVQHIGHGAFSTRIELYADSTFRQTFMLQSTETTIQTVVIQDDSSDATRKANINNPFDQLSSLDSKDIGRMAGPSQSLERLFMSLGGVATSSEFSSQYRVRGGNYDENLIYIHDIEIYRPQIVRSGLQEGLSITNPTPVSYTHLTLPTNREV